MSEKQPIKQPYYVPPAKTLFQKIRFLKNHVHLPYSWEWFYDHPRETHGMYKEEYIKYKQHFKSLSKQYVEQESEALLHSSHSVVTYP